MAKFMPMNIVVSTNKHMSNNKTMTKVTRTAFGSLYMLIIVFLISVLLILVWFIWVYNRDYRKCIKLPNGLYLGYSAVYDLNTPLLRPNPAGTIKYSDGTPLIDQALWAVFVNDKTAYGSTVKVTGGYSFAWRADVGLVFYSQDREMYKAIVEQTGKENYGHGTTSVGPALLMDYLATQPGFEVKWCKTRMFRWKNTK